MKFPKNMVITNITHISVANFKKSRREKMTDRPWYGIAFSLRGEMTYFHNANAIRLFGDKVVFIPKNATYEYGCKAPGEFAVINFLCEQELDIHDFLLFNTKDMEKFNTKFAKLHRLFLSSSPNKHYEIYSGLYELFSFLANEDADMHLPKPLADAMGYINKNLSSSSLCNTQIADYVGISEVYLRKLFTKSFGVSVGRYIKDKRIEKAGQLLAQTSMSITQISEACGFSCVYYFCTCFKQETGYTPTKYRQMHGVGLF